MSPYKAFCSPSVDSSALKAVRAAAGKILAKKEKDAELEEVRVRRAEKAEMFPDLEKGTEDGNNVYSDVEDVVSDEDDDDPQE